MLRVDSWVVAGHLRPYGMLMLVFAIAGCLQSPTVDCGNGLICGEGQVCFSGTTGSTFCATQTQIDACVEPNGTPKPDGALCGEPGSLDRCVNGFCQPSLCGNGVIDATVGEACEEGNVAGLPSCQQRGYDSGVIGCDVCTVDTNSCKSYCGDGVVDADEECDGDSFNSELATTCLTLGQASGEKFGSVTCTRDCRIEAKCAAYRRDERIVTLPPIPLDAVPAAAAVVDENDVWVVETRSTTNASYVAHRASDRWQRVHVGAAPLVISSTCDQIWAIHGAAVVGCQDGRVVVIDNINEARVFTLDGAVPVGQIYGLTTNDVWAVAGNKLWHFDGSMWSPDAESLDGNILSLDGDSTDVYVMTQNALFRRDVGGWVKIADSPESRGGSYRWLSMHVVDAQQFFIVVDREDGAELTVWDPTAPAALNEVTVGRRLLAGYKFVDANRFGVFTIENTNLYRWDPLKRVGQSYVQTVDFSLIRPVSGIVAVKDESIWYFQKGLGVSTLAPALHNVEVRDRDGSEFTVTGERPALLTESADGTLYFSIDDGTVQTLSSDIGPFNSATTQLTPQPRFRALAAVTDVSNVQLLVSSADRVFELDLNNEFNEPALMGNVRGLWSDGHSAFVIVDDALYRYNGANPANWKRVGSVPGNSDVLLTGGRINDTYTTWVVPAVLDGSPAIAKSIVDGDAVTTTMISSPNDMHVSAAWSDGHELWLAGDSSLARWRDNGWERLTVPMMQNNPVKQLWSALPGQVWLLFTNGDLLRFDGTRWWSTIALRLATQDGTEAATPLALSSGFGQRLWSATGSFNGLLLSPLRRLARLDNPHPPLTGGLCPAKQELFCRENGHGVTEGPRTISTIVGGRFGTSHYVLNSTILGNITFAGNLPPEVEAIWALPDASGTCPTGAPLGFASSGAGVRATQTLGPSRYFLTLRPRDATDATEYPVTLEYSCHRVD